MWHPAHCSYHHRIRLNWFARMNFCPATLTTAATIATIAGGTAAVGGALYGMSKGSPKAPAPVATPAAPTVNTARQLAGQEAANNARKGALANMLTPAQNSADLIGNNTSLKQLLGQ